jgi:hypothetical protein
MRLFSQKIDIGIFLIVAVVLIALIVLMSSNLYFQYMNYRDGIKLAIADPRYIDHASILTYSRAWDFAVIKTSALFLSFLLIFTGALYILRVGESQFSIEAQKGDIKASLASTSPGLIMVTLGVFLVAFVLWNKTSVDYSRQGLSQRQPVQVEKFQQETIEVEQKKTD